ncbi:hypothetical protein M9H77_07826 [Catharanthus roseus]|uniref:Uncharacterized protein n=1 Tax=Catharanthus roseus TaxID=4058 RepID=A0ACC0BW25_CATRO|nr:hypothetical protein M9H77_07826 [Catharanthus roseus]
MTIDQCLVKRIFVDTGSSMNVLFKETFKQMGIPWDKSSFINNEAEYEALLAGLHGAKYLNLTNILVRIDSEVVIGQVTGVFEAKEENIKQYLACVQQLVSEFTSVNFEKENEVSRVDPNRKLDPTREGPYQVIKDNGNGCYRLQDFEGNIQARMWNNLNLRKIFP